MEILEVNELNAGYGQGLVLQGLSLSVAEGDAVCLLGRNGAGKTTTLRAIVGLLRPKSGSVRFLGTDLVGRRPYSICRLGIGYVPEDRRLFPDLTVDENLEVARRTWAHSGEEVEGARARGAVWDAGRVMEQFPVLKPLARRRARYLSGGEQQMLSIGRALMTNPRLLLLDEPSGGLAPLVVRKLWQQIFALKQQGIALLVSEQSLGFAAEMNGRIYILDRGQIKFRGDFATLQQNPELKKAHLGV